MMAGNNNLQVRGLGKVELKGVENTVHQDGDDSRCWCTTCLKPCREEWDGATFGRQFHVWEKQGTKKT